MLLYHAYVLNTMCYRAFHTRAYLNRKEEKLTSMDDNEIECKCKAADACTLSMCFGMPTAPTSMCVVHRVYASYNSFAWNIRAGCITKCSYNFALRFTQTQVAEFAQQNEMSSETSCISFCQCIATPLQLRQFQ